MQACFSNTNNILTNVNVDEFPFPFGMARNSLSYDSYKNLASSRPDWKLIAKNKADENNIRVDLRAVDALKADWVPEIWKEFIRYHTSHDFYKVILTKFGDYFKSYYPQHDFDNFTTAIRYNQQKADLYLDCQIGINTPVKEKSTVSSPHLDHPLELWAGLLYMREDDDNAGGDFVTYKCRGIPMEYGKRQIYIDELIKHQTIAYNPNTFVCFMNSPFSVHAVTQRRPTEKPRLLVNFSLEFEDKPLFDMRRMR